MHRHWLVLGLVLIFTLVKIPSGALSEHVSPLSLQLNSLKCAGWSDVALGQSIAATNQKLPVVSSSISDELLKEYGCQDKAERILQRGQRKIFIDAYQFATKEGAYGAYSAARRGSSSYKSLGDASSEDQDSLSLYKDNYFIYLHSSEIDDDEAKSAINKLTKQLVDQLNSNKNVGIYERNNYPEIFHSLPSLERLSGSEKIIMGPISLKKFFPAPYVNALTPLLEGAIADYKIEEPHRDRLKLLIAYYPTAQAASMTYANYVSTLANQNNEKPTEGFSYTTNLFKVSDSFILCQLRDKRIIVINGARHKDTLSALAHQIYLY